MHPLTKDCPKPLLPVGPRSLVEHQIASLERVGVGRIVLATGYRHEDFTDLVASVRAKGVDLTTVVEASPQGTGGGLRDALRTLPDAAQVIVLNGDLLTGHDLGAQCDRLRSAPPEVVGSVHVRTVPDARAYGSVVTDGQGRITEFVEKSASPPSLSVNAGTYVVRPALLADIPPAGVVSLEHDVFPLLARRRALLAHREDAYFLDVGSPAALLTANRDLVGGDALVLPGAVVAPRAHLSDGTVVHPGARIAPGARVEASLVLAGARIEDDAHVVGSVVGRRTRVGAGARVVESVLGSDEDVRPGEDLRDARRPRA